MKTRHQKKSIPDMSVVQAENCHQIGCSRKEKIWQETVAYSIEQQLLNGTSSNNSEYSPYHKGKKGQLKKAFEAKCHELKAIKESEFPGPTCRKKTLAKEAFLSS